MTTSENIAARIVDAFNERRRQRNYREMSAREAERLRVTSTWLADTALKGQPVHDEFDTEFIDQVQSYYRDEWYGLHTQIEYLQLLRREILAVLDDRGRPAAEDVFDHLMLLAVKACRRPDRYEWPTLILVGFGHLAKTKLAAPLKALKQHNPLDVIVVDKKASALRNAERAFKNSLVKVMSADEIGQVLKVRGNPRIIYVATESKTHFPVVAHYIQYPDVRAIAIEKPLTTNLEEVQKFRDLARRHRDTKLVVVDHYIFRRAALMIERVKREEPALYKAIADRISKLTFVMNEVAEVAKERAASKEGVILDMLPHLFPFVTMFLTNDVSRLEITDVKAWRYEGSKGKGETAVEVRMQFGETTVLARAGKALDKELKHVEIVGAAGNVILDLATGAVSIGKARISLGETPSADAGYGWVLYNLVSAPELEFQSVETASMIVEKLLAIRDLAHRSGIDTYEKGKSPF